MGGDCFNWNKSDKDLFLKKKKTENAINSENCYIKNYRKNSYNNIPLQLQSEYNINSNKTNISHYKQYLDSNNITKPIKTLGKRSNSFKIIDKEKMKHIYRFTREELEEEINDILRIRIPFFENDILKTISALSFLSGNGPYHEGLMFFTTNKNFYVAQSYPITFIKVYDFFSGISEIISFNNMNKNAKKYNIPEIYMPRQRITLFNILNIINSLPNKYNLINDNCQNFCNNIIDALKNKFIIELDDNPSKEKINFLKKIQKKKKTSLIPFNNSIFYRS
jgi:hypothetical protein